MKFYCKKSVAAILLLGSISCGCATTRLKPLPPRDSPVETRKDFYQQHKVSVNKSAGTFDAAGETQSLWKFSRYLETEGESDLGWKVERHPVGMTFSFLSFGLGAAMTALTVGRSDVAGGGSYVAAAILGGVIMAGSGLQAWLLWPSDDSLIADEFNRKLRDQLGLDNLLE